MNFEQPLRTQAVVHLLQAIRPRGHLLKATRPKVILHKVILHRVILHRDTQLTPTTRLEAPTPTRDSLHSRAILNSHSMAGRAGPLLDPCVEAPKNTVYVVEDRRRDDTGDTCLTACWTALCCCCLWDMLT